MDIRPLIASAAFFGASCFYHSVGLYALNINYKRRKNQFFFVLSVVLTIWTLSFSFAIQADSAKEALFWYQFSTLGWGTFYSFLFHFYHFSAYPQRKRGRLFYLFTYLPTLFNVIVFMFLGAFSTDQFTVVKNCWGWTYLLSFNWLNVYLVAYILLFFSLSLRAFYMAYKRAKDSRSKWVDFELDLYLMFAMVVMVAVDIFIRYTEFPFINLICLWMIIPTLRIFYIIKRPDFLDFKRREKSDKIVGTDVRNMIFEMVGFVYVLTAYLAYGTFFLSRNIELNYLLVLSAIFYCMGVSHFIIKKLIAKTENQYLFMTLLASLSMFLSAIIYYEDGGITIWAIYFFFIMITSLFDSLIYCYIVTGVLALVQLLYWYLLPRYNVLIDCTDYLFRILIIFGVWLIVQYIHRLYHKKTREYNYQKLIQETLTELSHNLLDVNLDNYQAKFQYSLALWNGRFNYSDSYIYVFSEDKQSGTLVLHQNGDNFCSQKTESEQVEYAILQDYLLDIGDFKNGNSIFIEDIELLPDKVAEFKSVLRAKGVLGFYALPIIVNGDAGGLLYFEFNEARDYIFHYDYKKVLSNLLSDSLQTIAFQKRMFKDANIDQVTGLYTRAHLTHELQRIIEQSTEEQRHVLIVLDLDNFKNTNDIFGHFIGDKALHKIGVALRSICSKGDLIARFGGDEFMIFSTDSEDEQQTYAFVEAILNAFKTPIYIDSQEINLSASIGVAVYPQDGKNMETLIKNADLAMYESKKMGKNRYHFCSDDAKRQTMENALYKDHLLNALDNDEFKLVYQPQINLKTGKISGAEALLRWDSPEFGSILPHKFIPILEHTGFIIEVGEWIIKSVIEQYLRMRQIGLPDFSISINLSYVQLQNKNFCERIAEIIQFYDVNPSFLELEILEKDIFAERSDFSEILLKIKSLGCRIAIDDFGIEFSSLNRLQLLQVDRLKIDRSFVEGIGVDNKKESVVDVIIELAKTFGFKSIAEGVETKAQMDYLRSRSCEDVQGYYNGQPLTPNEFVAFISDKVDTKQILADAY